MWEWLRDTCAGHALIRNDKIRKFLADEITKQTHHNSHTNKSKKNKKAGESPIY